MIFHPLNRISDLEFKYLNKKFISQGDSVDRVYISRVIALDASLGRGGDDDDDYGD